MLKNAHASCRYLIWLDWAPATDNERGTMNLYVLKTWLKAKYTKDEQGANLVEYILLVALIALAVIAAVTFLSGEIGSKFSDTGTKLHNAPTP